MAYRVVLDGMGRVERDGVPLSFRTSKALELVLYLGVHGESVRQEAGRQLWPDLDHDRRAANLRLSLSYIRASAPELVASEGKSLRVNAEVVSTPDSRILTGVDSAWAGSARDGHLRKSTEQFLHVADQEGDLDSAFRARENDPYLQAPRLMIAQLWIARNEPGKAAAELRDYALLIRRDLKIDIEAELFTKAGLSLPDAQPTSARIFAALTPREQALAVLGQCPAWLAAGRIFHARMRIEQVLEIQRSKSVKCRLQTWKSRFESEAGEFALALESAKVASDAATTADEGIAAETVLLRAKLFLMGIEEVVSGVENLRQKKMGDEAKADLLIVGAVAEYYRNHPQEAIRLSAESLRAAERAHSQFRMVAALGLLGSSHFLAGDFAAASDYAGRAAEVAGQFGMRVREANALGLKGRAEEGRGNLDLAESLYMKAVEMVTATDSLHIYGILVTYLGDILVKRGKVRAGLEWLKKGALARRHSSDLVGQSTSNRCIARGYLALGELPNAEKFGRKAFELATTSARDFEVALNEVILAEIEFARGRKMDGVEYLRRALPIVRREHREGRSSMAEDPIFDPERIAGVIAAYR